MNNEILLLSITAASIGFIHTLAGPDHYLPFIVLAKARHWTFLKTTWITFICGIGHVGTSVILGFIGVLLGIGMEKVEGVRGNMAAWTLIVFGLVYMIWGIYRSMKNKSHTHSHFHNEGTVHDHEHHHSNGHEHQHKDEKVFNYTPWVLFIIFALGPCELLIPQLMVPASQNNLTGVVIVALVFSIFTILTMLAVVLLSTYFLKSLPFGKLEKHTHTIAGAMIFLSGCAIVFLGL